MSDAIRLLKRGRVVFTASGSDTDLFRSGWIPERAKTLHYLGGSSYGVLERRAEVPGGGSP
jgi:hypothetical protein